MDHPNFESESDLVIKLVRESEYLSAHQVIEGLFSNVSEKIRHRVLRLRAYVYEESGQTDLALADLDAAIEFCPSSSASYDARIMLNIRLANFTAVESDCTRLLEMEEKKGSLYFVNAALISRGMARIFLGRGKDAIDDFQRVDDEGPFRRQGRSWTKAELIELARNS